MDSKAKGWGQMIYFEIESNNKTLLKEQMCSNGSLLPGKRNVLIEMFSFHLKGLLSYIGDD